MNNPPTARQFRFAGRQFDPRTGEAQLAYAFDSGPPLIERITFPWAPWPSDATRQAAFFRALELLHLVAGVSYWKAALPQEIDIGDLALDEDLAGFADRLYRHGLAEFAHRNGLDLEGRIAFPSRGALKPGATELDLPARSLVAIGGGKDSLVSLESLREGGEEVQPFCVGGSSLIAETVHAAGLPLIRIERVLAPELSAMNEAGAWNGHVPVTAINMAIGTCAALLYGFGRVVFSNERSADEPTLRDAEGRPVNHQYSKGFDHERDFQRQVDRQISPGLRVFSLLRPWTELAIAQRFSRLTAYHPVFSSCNRNFHQDGSRIDGRWCGDCPKCRFTTLALAPFMARADVVAILGADLMDDLAQSDGYRALLGLDADKPFECVGTTAECRAAFAALANRDDWRAAKVVQALVGDALVADAPSLDDCLMPRGEHAIPAELTRHAQL